MIAEQKRLQSPSPDPMTSWKKWGAYVSERMWGTVREDYSENGDAWNYITHDKARSMAYRWGEDGLAGFCDTYQMLVFSVALWNGKDPILKERLFGLNPYEGNHGEDVKECYYYLDATPTHSYLKYLYKYPQKEFPYQRLVEENKKRSPSDQEYELYQTGVFEENRYFDVGIEYAKADIDDICIRIEVINRGPDPAALHVLPQLYFRNRWSWDNVSNPKVPSIQPRFSTNESIALFADPTNLPPPHASLVDYHLPPMYLYGKPTELLFTNNETHFERLWNVKSRTPYVKDAFHRAVIQGEQCTNPDQVGTKACFHYQNFLIPSGQSKILRFRLSRLELKTPLDNVDAVVKARKEEADEFYASLHPIHASQEDRLIQRQAIAGMLWNQQYYFYDVNHWFSGDNPSSEPSANRYKIRNFHWKHLHAADVISMPDKWEYPWFASWDLAFHAVTLSLVDINLAKQQLHMVLQHQYQHPNGQIPAYEWGFSDLNPPVQAWALWRIYCQEKKVKKEGDVNFLQLCFLKLLRNFNWWVNKVDKVGNNFFEGGFLGLDNISIIDRSKPLPDGGSLEQSDGTGWMGFFSLMMMRISLELAKHYPILQVMGTIFLEHFFYIAAAMQERRPHPGSRALNMWDEEDGFFYDVVSYPDGRHEMLKVRSFVGMIPAYSLDYLEEEELATHPSFHENFLLFMKANPLMTERFITKISHGGKIRYLLSMATLPQLKRILKRAISPEEFFSPYGLRSLSKFHENTPFFFEGFRVAYEVAESLEKIKGGNSNWRGPIWFPTNYLFLDAMEKLKKVVGGEFLLETTEKESMTLSQMIDSLRERLIALFKKDPSGRRPVHGNEMLYDTQSEWEDLILFYEYFHGENGRGLGASHQTGWTGLVANLIAEHYLN